MAEEETAAVGTPASTGMDGRPEIGDSGVRGRVGLSAEDAFEEGEVGTTEGTRSIIEADMVTERQRDRDQN
jgi:hypothetical protein